MSKIVCACGQVELEARGAPILMAACHCDDCQTGGHLIEALPGALPVLDAAGGTAYALIRKDRVTRVKGGDLLKGYRIREGSATRRMVATCCNSAMLVEFDGGPHWVSVYRDRMVDPPQLEMRVNTRFVPAGASIPADAPAYRSFPPRFVGKLIGARLAMLFSR